MKQSSVEKITMQSSVERITVQSSVYRPRRITNIWFAVANILWQSRSTAAGRSAKPSKFSRETKPLANCDGRRLNPQGKTLRICFHKETIHTQLRSLLYCTFYCIALYNNLVKCNIVWHCTVHCTVHFP